MDDDWSIEIVYEAEVLNIEECPELLELARQQLHENEETRSANIDELRTMVYERGECSPRRMDDAFLLRFLRARKHNVPRAYDQLVRYCRFLRRYPELYQDVDLFALALGGEALESTMYDHPDCGRLVIVRPGFWDPNEYPIDILAKAGLAILEIGLRQPKMQVLGGTVIIDFERLGPTQVSHFTLTRMHQLLSLLGIAIPVRLKSIHFVNYNWLMSPVFYMTKRLVSSSLRMRSFFHGSDVKALLQHIEPSCLPVRYGGTCTSYHESFEFWLNKIKQYRDERFVQDMKDFGYVIKE